MEPTGAEQAPPNRMLWVGIAIMCAGPVLAVVGTIGGIMHSFWTIENEAAPTPAALERGVEWSIVAPIAGLFVGAIGFAIAAYALWTRQRARKSAERSAL
jgi:biopolymer transport protein ExbB/TolQ